MSSSRVGERTRSKRLKILHSYHYQSPVIWDVGCDHGLLGSSFSDEPFIQEIHLVDPSLSVMNKLRDSYITIANIHLHHDFGQNIKLRLKPQTVFIAGMGGKEIQEILKNLIPQMTVDDHVVISPHKNILETREFLQNSLLRCLKEEVIKDGTQFYQILSLGLHPSWPKVSLYGDELWSSKDSEEYREREIRHFSLHQDGPSQRYLKFLLHK